VKEALPNIQLAGGNDCRDNPFDADRCPTDMELYNQCKSLAGNDPCVRNLLKGKCPAPNLLKYCFTFEQIMKACGTTDGKNECVKQMKFYCPTVYATGGRCFTDKEIRAECGLADAASIDPANNCVQRMRAACNSSAPPVAPPACHAQQALLQKCGTTEVTNACVQYYTQSCDLKKCYTAEEVRRECGNSNNYYDCAKRMNANCDNPPPIEECRVTRTQAAEQCQQYAGGAKFEICIRQLMGNCYQPAP
jgi:hypothetical protein